MNDSHIERLILAAVLAGGLAVAPPAVAQSDDGKPLRLVPPKLLEPPARPAEPATGRGQPPTRLPPSAPRRASDTRRPPAPPAGAIQVDALRTPDADSVGTLGAGGGFGVAMWQGTSRAVVDALLPRLPVDAASPAMRDLAHRLLLSVAAVPRGGAGDEGGEAAGKGTLIALRARLLAAMGDQAGVGALLEMVPARSDNEPLMRIETDARFLANDNARACPLAAEQIVRNPSPYWQKAFIFCQALAGEHDRAALGIALLRETGEADDVFYVLVDALSGSQVPSLDSMPQPTPLHLTMARAANVQLPADVIASDAPGVLGTVAVSPNAPVELRLEAAERAEAAGALAVDVLRQLYTSVSFSEEALANPLSKAEAESGPLSRALLYRTALVQTVPTARAEAIGRALDLAREGGRYASAVRAFLPVLAQVTPSAELMWFAPEAVRAFLVGGDHQALRRWLGLMRAGALFDEGVRAVLWDVLPLARLAGSEDAEAWSAEQLRPWWQRRDGGDEARRRAALLYTLLEALGDDLPEDLWEALLDGPQRTMVAMPRPALWQRLAAAADGGRVGETVLLSLLALGEGGPAAANPVILRRVLVGLRSVGLEAEARAIAVEAAVAAGI